MSKLDQFLSVIGNYVDLSNGLKESLTQHSEIVELKRNEHLFDTGSTCRNMFFLVQGTIRSYGLYDGRDVTSWFYTTPTFLTSWSSYYNEKPALDFIQATEKSVVAVFPKNILNEIYLKHPKLEHYSRGIMEKAVADMEDFYRGFMFMPAEDRYHLLISQHPNLEQRVNLGHIASFIGISQETLSRLRAQPKKED